MHLRRHGCPYLAYIDIGPYTVVCGRNLDYAMNSVRAKVSKSGRLSIPAAFRKAAGIEAGGDVVVELEGREIKLRPVDEVVKQAQALSRRLLQNKPGTSLRDFLALRRAEAKRE